jgi:hypothetical protein
MKSLTTWLVCAACAVSLAAPVLSPPCVAAEGERMLAHDVYFTLKDNSPQAREALVAACDKYLSGHPGTVWFGAGPLADELRGNLNDRDFDVALHLVFKNKAALDQYIHAARHLKFIEETKDLWKKVRVFDSYVTVPCQK